MVSSSIRVFFDSKINTWAEGTLLTIDADASKISIRGTKHPYASEYTKMLISIHEKTEGMTPADHATKAAEIRRSWHDALEKARTKEFGEDGDMTFHLPGGDSKLVVVDERPFYGEVPQSTVSYAATAMLTDAEFAAVLAMKDLKVGEPLVVGYASGLLRNEAFVLIKTSKRIK